MYQEYYGLREMPFNITPDPRFLFLSSKHQDALENLRVGIQQRKGFLVLTGEVGCGKTTVCRALLDELEAADIYDTALVVNPRLSETQLIRTILGELGEPTRERGKNALMEKLNAFLFERAQEGREIVVIIDEAQNMSFETLEQLRLISNIETDSQKLVQIVLIGQPELKATLQEERLRQLRQRILVHYDLGRLSREEVQHYIVHRLHLAGGNGRPAFSSFAVRRLYAYSKGTPRIINNVCDKALLAAFVRNDSMVRFRDVGRAIREIKQLS